jgi:hypothetical protein
MPSLFRLEGFVFSFYSSDGNEPVHVHVRKAGGAAKIWMEPISLARAEDMDWRDIKRAMELAEHHKKLILEKWNEYFPNQ